MKLMVARVGSFRGWILVAGLGLMVPAVALVGSKGLAKTGPALGLAQSSASQIDASPLMKRIQSIAQPPRLRIIKERLAALAPALAPSAPALMPFAPVTITKDASPISGSAVTQGQVIAYNIQATNGASSDTTVGAGGFVRIIDTAPTGTLFTIVTVQQQPQFGSAWSCTILGGGTSIQCSAGDGAGAGVDTFTTQEFVKIRAEVQVQASTVNGTTLTNTATYQFDNDGGGLEGTATSDAVVHVVNPTADLGITKVTSNPTPTAGGAAFSYTVTVTNNGPNPATNVIVSDPLPPGIIFQNLSVVMNPVSPAMTCTGPPVGTNGTIICNSANFTNGQSAIITIVAQVVSNVASGVRTNTASVTSGTPEPVPNVFPNTASIQQNIVVDAPLSITKAGPATVCAGDTLTYHVTVLNGGSSTALNATINDPLPANTTFLSVHGTGGFANACQFNGGTPGSVTCAAVDLPTGLSTMDITVKLAPSAPSGPLGNTAQITTAGTGTIAVGTATTTATVEHCSDLEITKDDSPDTVSAGQDINYTIKVRNIGPSNIASGEFVVNDTTFPPTGTTLKAGTVINAPGFNCSGGVTFPCTATSTLAVGATAVINYSVTVNANFNAGQPGGFIVNTATVNIVGGSNATDPIATNNSSTSNTPVSPTADLSITNTAETLAGAIFGASVTAGGTIAGTPPSPVTGTGEILYTLTYRNNGPGDATNVHVRDDIPAGTLLDPTFLPIGVVVTPAAGPGLTCQILPTLINYQLDCTPNTGNAVLPAAANGTIQFRVRVPENIAEGTVIRNQATINSEGIAASQGTPDPIGGNNTSNETQNIVRTIADLAITKTGPASVVAGNIITYTLTVTNNGSSDAQNVLVKDTLPPNVSFVSLGAGTDSRFACQPDNGNAGIVNCTTATLIAPAVNPPPIIPPRSGSNVATITIIGRVNANVANGTVLTNNASVSASTQDPAAASNAALPVNTTVTTDAAVTIIKTDSPDPVTAGNNLTYNITVNNNGPSDAQAVNVVDTLPPATQVQFLSAVGTGVFSAANSCTRAANVVTCSAIPGGVFAAGASANITIVVRVLSSVPASVPPDIPDNASGLLNSATINWTDSNGAIGPLVAQSATDTERTTVRRESLNADLSVTKGALTIAGGTFGAAVTAGGGITPGFGTDKVGLGEIEYTIAYGNNGVDDATNVHIRDVIPAGTLLDPTSLPTGVVITPVSGPGLVCQILPTSNEYQLDCTPNTAGGVLPAGANGTIQFAVRVPENILDGTVIKNIATINSEGSGGVPATPDPNGGNNTSNETQNIVRTSADLVITKTGPASVTAGNNITYSLFVTNKGVSDAQNVLVKDTLPPNVSFVSLGAGSDSRFACQPDNGNAGIVNCTAATLIAPAIFAPPITPPRVGINGTTIIIIGKVAASVANGTVLTNNASISTSTQDPVLANNAAAAVSTTVTTDAAVTIIKTDSPDPVIAGNNLTYNITVNNNGPSDAQAVNVVDTLPPATQVQFLSAVGTGIFSAANSCTQAANVVTCSAIPGGVFAAGASANITIVVRVLPGVPPNVPPNIPDNASGLLNSATINWTDSNTVIGPLVAQSATDTERTTVRNDSSTLSINDVTVTEGTGGTTNATFTVTMAAQSSLPVTVDYTTSDNTASAPGDYTSQSGTLTFAPGVTTRNIIVPVVGDSLPETIETFLVTLFNPTNGTIGTAQGTGTINDDDASGVFQFSAATANVNENASPGSISLTINRTGDTTGVASVGFETSDITALQKTDYTFNSGTVQFGPGVTSKTIDILIVNDAFVEGPETFRVNLLNASGNFVVGPIGSSVVTITSDDAVLGPNPIDAAGFFVRQQYLDFLGREPDPAGLAFWTAQITVCGVNPACIEERRVNVSGSFFLSIEFQETSGNVIRAQRVAFARQSGDPLTRISYLPFMRDTRKVGQGVIFGQPGADLLLEQNKQAYAQEIVSSPAFIARFPVAPAATYVDALYASAAVTPTAAERTAAINAFGAGGIPGRVAALRSISDSDSVRVAEFRTSFVLVQYFGYLRRNPTDAPDFNNAGYQFWLDKLNLFNGNFQQAEMVKAFIASSEYRGRFGTP